MYYFFFFLVGYFYVVMYVYIDKMWNYRWKVFGDISFINDWNIFNFEWCLYDYKEISG